MYPKMKQPPTARKRLEVFGGYDHRQRIPEGAWYHMENLTSDGYPLLTPRAPRGILPETGNFGVITGITYHHGLCLTAGSCFYLPDGRAIELQLEESPKNLVRFGAYVLIFPDKKWVNVAAAMQSDTDVPQDAYGAMENTWQGQQLTVSGCLSDGSAFPAADIPSQRPENPTHGQLWRDYSQFPAVLKQWSEDTGTWQTDVKCWTRLEAENIGKGFAPGDRIRISGIDPGAAEFQEYALVSAVGEDGSFLAVEGQTIKDNAYCVGNMVLSRSLPALDYVFACGNRLWGCRYGADQQKTYNEIYCSKLGDFTNFYSFRGVSTDSYVASVGVDGPFTGAVEFQGRPVFFKENTLIEVFGDYPENYRVRTTGCDGVQPGSHQSLAVANNVLYYKGTRGVFAFDGSLPVPVGEALGEEAYCDGIGGSCAGKYYLSLLDESKTRQLFVYDTRRGLWHREDSLEVLTLLGHGKSLYCLCREHPAVVMLTGQGQPLESRVTWLAESGEIGLSLPESKYLSRLTLRLWLAPETVLRVSVAYDAGPWEHIYSLQGTDLGSVSLPIRPKRCDHMRLRLEGAGKAGLYSIAQTIEQGSEVF